MADCACNHFPASLGNVTFDASVGVGTTSPGAKLTVSGLGSSQVESGTATTAADLFGATTDRARLTVGNTNAGTGTGQASRSAELLFYGYNPAGTALQAKFELGTDAEQNGTQSLFVYDTVARAFRLYLGPTGNLGVGTNVPASPLHVAGTIRYSSGASGMVGLVDNDNHAIRSNGAGAQVFANAWGIASQGWVFRDDANAVDRVTIQGAGNVGIGTTAPAYPLDVNGVARVSGVLLVGQDVTLNGAINKSIGGKIADQGGCYYA